MAVKVDVMLEQALRVCICICICDVITQSPHNISIVVATKPEGKFDFSGVNSVSADKVYGTGLGC